MIGGFNGISNYRTMNETIFASRNNIAELQEMLYTIRNNPNSIRFNKQNN
jgi:hypothetical protein